MAEQEKVKKHKSAGETRVVVVGQLASRDSRSKPTEQDDVTDGLHKWQKVPDIPSVAEKIPNEFREKGHIIPKPSDQTKETTEISDEQAAMMQSTTSHGPDVKPLESIELAKIEPNPTVSKVKQCIETTFPAKMESEPVVVKVKRFETTFPKRDSEPVVKRLESSATSKKESNLGVEAANDVETVINVAATIPEATALALAVKMKPSVPIPLEVQTPTVEETLEKTVEEQTDGDSYAEDNVDPPVRLQTKLSSWSDDGEAGGLPRTESMSSKMSRAVRQLFCCGVAYAAPSEDDISSCRLQSGI